MKQYLVTLIPENKISEEGCDAALADVHLWILAEGPEEAGEKAVKIMKKHKLYCKVYLVRGGGKSSPKILADYANGKAAKKERRLEK